jgi:hypothetical protein
MRSRHREGRREAAVLVANEATEAALEAAVVAAASLADEEGCPVAEDSAGSVVGSVVGSGARGRAAQCQT